MSERCDKDFFDNGIKVGKFDRCGLLEEGLGLESSGYKLRPMSRVLVQNIPADGAAFIQDEAVVVLSQL
jgi:hypothetical protein